MILLILIENDKVIRIQIAYSKDIVKTKTDSY